MAPSARRRCAGYGWWNPAFSANNVEGQHDRLHDGRMDQRGLAGGRGGQLEMGMAAAVVRACQLRTGPVVAVRGGMGLAMVLSGVVVRDAVNRLGEEEAYPKEKGEQDDGEARATQVSHRRKITRKPMHQLNRLR